MKISATMCVARHSYKESLDSLVNLNRPDEVLLSPNEGFEECCQHADVCIEVTPENPWDPYGRHKLYDMATGEWYLTLDDDDIAVEPLVDVLDSVEDNVGLVFGDVITRWAGRHGVDRGETIRRNDHDFTLKTANRWAGGYYALRAEAWDDIRQRMFTNYMIHGDSRLFYHMLKAGWTWHRIPKFCEITRLGQSLIAWEKYTPGWDAVFEHLEKGDSPEEWLIRD